MVTRAHSPRALGLGLVFARCWAPGLAVGARTEPAASVPFCDLDAVSAWRTSGRTFEQSSSRGSGFQEPGTCFSTVPTLTSHLKLARVGLRRSMVTRIRILVPTGAALKKLVSRVRLTPPVIGGPQNSGVCSATIAAEVQLGGESQ